MIQFSVVLLRFNVEHKTTTFCNLNNILKSDYC